MKNIKIKSKEYKICDITDKLTLFILELNREIAISLLSVKLRKVALARAVDKKQLTAMIKEFNEDNLIENNLIQVKIIGGDKSKESADYLASLITWLKEIDNNTNIINITSLDTGIRLHPNSFAVDCYHGGIREL